MQFRLDRSRCTYFMDAKYSMPQAIWEPKLINCLVLNAWWRFGVPRAFRRNWFKSAFFKYGITTIGDWLFWSMTPNKGMMFLCCNRLIINASVKNFVIQSQSSGDDVRVFRATGVKVILSSLSRERNLPWWTLPEAPAKKWTSVFSTVFKRWESWICVRVYIAYPSNSF